MTTKRENTHPEVIRTKEGKFVPGVSPNPGGRPRRLVEIDNMLNEEHRTVANLREAFAVLKRLALEGTEKGVYYKGERVATEREYHEGFLKLYFDRLLGPLKELTDDEFSELLRDAPETVVDWARKARLS